MKKDVLEALVLLIVVAVIVVAIVGFAHFSSPKIQIVDVKIIDVYREFKLGTENGTTIIELPDGTRRALNGRLGEKGETIKIQIYK